MKPHGMHPVFVALNILWVVVFLAGLLILGLTLVYGVGFSGDSGEEKAMGAAGVAVLATPLFLSMCLGLIAAVGLHKKTSWGYAAHLALAAVMAFTCIGAPYTLLAVLVCTSASYRAFYFDHPEESWAPVANSRL
jgi:predicted transporter